MVRRRPSARGRSVTPAPRYDFHSHTFLTDGSASPTDMWTEAGLRGHRALAITDHLSMEDPAPLIERLRGEARAFEDSPLIPVFGVEVSMVPTRHLARVARGARLAGAEIVIVHGESPVESVPEGTNRAAILSGEVDVLAHPGLLEPDDAELAREHEVYLELSARRGHSLANGHVARTAVAARAALLVDSDAHAPSDLVPIEFARRIAAGSGLTPEGVGRALGEAPRRLLRRLGKG